jgi:hypothetical protein
MDPLKSSVLGELSYNALNESIFDQNVRKKIANLFFVNLDRDEMVIKPISRFRPFNDKNLTLQTWLFFGCLYLRQGSDDV